MSLEEEKELKKVEELAEEIKKMKSRLETREKHHFYVQRKLEKELEKYFSELFSEIKKYAPIICEKIEKISGVKVNDEKAFMIIKEYFDSSIHVIIHEIAHSVLNEILGEKDPEKRLALSEILARFLERVVSSELMKEKPSRLITVESLEKQFEELQGYSVFRKTSFTVNDYKKLFEMFTAYLAEGKLKENMGKIEKEILSVLKL